MSRRTIRGLVLVAALSALLAGAPAPSAGAAPRNAMPSGQPWCC